MPNPFSQAFRFNRGYWPSQTFGGQANDTIFRGRNVVFKGGPETVYAECFKGNERMTSPVGTSIFFGGASCEANNGSTDVLLTIGGGASDPVNSYLLPGHLIQIDDRLFIITSIASPTQLKISPPFDGISGSGKMLYVPYLCHSANQALALMPGGGSIQGLQKGHFLLAGGSPIGQVHVGSGKYGGSSQSGAFAFGGAFTFPGMLRFEDAALPPNADLVGFNQPVIPSINPVLTGGTKNMPASTYSMRIARARLGNNGFGPLSEAKEVYLNTANLRIELEFPPVSSVFQTAWRVFGSLYSAQEGVTGPWYDIGLVTETTVSAASGRKLVYEWRDYEIAGRDLASFDNNAPPRSSFVAYFGGIPVLLGAYGKAPTGVTASGFDPDNYPFGPIAQPGKANNPEGFPPLGAVVIGQPEPIIGFVEAEGRLYLMTKNNLHMAVLSGDPVAPLVVRPFAQSAFARQGNLVYVEGVLYGFTRNGAVRYQTGGDIGIEDRSFAAIIAEDMEHWVAERVCVGYDPASQSVVYFHANDHDDGFGNWETMALAYHTKLGVWSTPINVSYQELASQDFNVTSCCTLGGKLHFMAAGYVWVWNSPPPTTLGFTIDWWMLSPYVDQAAETFDKTIEGLVATFFTGADDARVGIFGVQSDDVVDLDNATEISNSTAMGLAKSGSIVLAHPPFGSNLVKASRYVKLEVPRLKLYAVRFGSTFLPGPDAKPDRVDEIVVDGLIHGPKH